MQIIKTIYGEELCRILLVAEVKKFLKEINASVDTSKLQKYGFKEPIHGFRIEFFDKAELFKSIDSKIAFEIEYSIITFHFPADEIKAL